MSDDWYHAISGQQHGPMSFGELKRLGLSGKLRLSDLVWKEGMPNWISADRINGLFNGKTSDNEQSHLGVSQLRQGPMPGERVTKGEIIEIGYTSAGPHREFQEQFEFDASPTRSDYLSPLLARVCATRDSLGLNTSGPSRRPQGRC